MNASWFGLGEVLDSHARTRGREVALVCGAQRLTWAEVAARTDALAGILAARGVGPGDRVLWLGQNCHRVVEALFAAARLGAVLCPANWRSSVDELRSVIDDADARVVLWQEEEIGATVAAARTGDGLWIRHDGEYESLLGSAPPVALAPVDPTTPVLMLYTAAFDGHPNGALLSQTALLAQTTTLRLLEGVGAGEVFLNSGPLFHIGTLRRTLAVAHAGGRNVMVRRPDTTEMCRLVDAERCTSAFLQRPTQEQMVAVAGGHDLTSLCTPPGPPGWDELVTVVKDGRVRSGYGQTEVAGVVTFAMPDRPTVGGVPGPLADVQVLDPDGTPVAVGETGEITVRGPMVMTGYHRRPELTAHRQRHGRHHTGDLGRREPDGSISFVGPLQHMIKSGGENIYPAEVEAALRRHPDVARAAVIGLPDPSWGQRVLAVVVAAPGRAPDPDALIEHCRGELAGYKRPRAVEFVDALPDGPTDYSVDYGALDVRFGGGGYPGSG